MRLLNGYRWLVSAWGCIVISCFVAQAQGGGQATGPTFAKYIALAGLVCAIIGVICCELDYRRKDGQ